MKATVRGKKTDRSDAVLIARLGLRGEGQLQTSADTSGKQLLRTATKFTELAQTISHIQNSMAERQVPLPEQATQSLDDALAALRTATDACSCTAQASLDNKLIERLSRALLVSAYELPEYLWLRLATCSDSPVLTI